MNKFLNEITEQPNALRETLAFYTEGKGLMELSKVMNLWNTGKYDKFIFTGMGSSYFISYALSSLFNKYSLPSFSVDASELLHYQLPLLDDKSLLVCISQSGESYEIVKLLQQLPSSFPVVSICNEPSSFLARYSDACLLSFAGREEMTSTKTFTSAYLIAYILSSFLTRRFDAKVIGQIDLVIKAVEHQLMENDLSWLNGVVKLLGKTSFIQLIGRGPTFAAVQQTALMLMEATSTNASATLGGEFRHGPMEVVKEGFKAIVFAPLGETYDQLLQMGQDIVKFGGDVIFISNGKGILSSHVLNIFVPCEDNDLFTVPSIIPMQLLVDRWASERKIVPGTFCKGAKVTRIE